MKNIIKYLPLLILLTSIISCKVQDQNIENYTINNNWVFKSVNDSVWKPATVPGSVHTDLLNNGLIEDPYYRMVEHDIQWIDKNDWVYKTIFTIDEETLEKEQIELIFKGLDTYAQIILNDSLVLTTDNMFMSWELDCKEFLIEGENELRIIFESPINKGLEKRLNLGYFLPGAENDQSELGGLDSIKTCVFSRKPGYHFGWDWGPRLVTSGIWQDIELKAWNKAKILDVNILQEQFTDTLASLSANIEVEVLKDCEVTIKYEIDGEFHSQKNLDLGKGINQLIVPIFIKDPELWWTNGLGEQKLYNIKITIADYSGIISVDEKKIGLRKLKLVQKPDSIGKSFYFELNGHPVFMKGANYIPQDMFLDRVSDEDYEYLIKSAVDANFNMLRVWGGGIYEKDIFYDLCDKHGILVWQDFMFACAMYPGNQEFLDNVEAEAIQNVKRLRNHTSIALWCGDNENLSAWNRWGWKENVLENQGQNIVDTIWKAYDDVIHKILPEVVDELDPAREYWPSSPSSGFGELENGKSGDMHYWGVWWGKEPFSEYEKVIPRFMSEFGFQSFPNINTVKKYTTEEDWDIYSDVMKSHQRSSIGNVTVEEYLLRDYKTPKDFEMFLYVGQLLQAKGIKIGIEAQRRNMPVCMGSLYWQLNDVWPVASWSGIDYYGNWKALHYAVKDAFKDVKISFEKNEKELKLFVINDELIDSKYKLLLEVIDFNGNKINVLSKDLDVKANSSNNYLKEKIGDLIKGKSKNELLINASLFNVDGDLIDNTIYYFNSEKDLVLPTPSIEFDIQKTGDNFKLIFSTDVLAKNLYINIPVDGHLSENYIDILPNNTKEFTFTPKEDITIEDLSSIIKYYTLTDSYE